MMCGLKSSFGSSSFVTIFKLMFTVSYTLAKWETESEGNQMQRLTCSITWWS